MLLYVPQKGLEPLLLSELDFESSASANSATEAARKYALLTARDAR